MSMSQRHLGPYELQQRTASDSISEIWKAFDTQQRRYVLIKILRLHSQATPDAMTRFLHEMQSLKSLHHPNIVQVLDVQVSQGPGAMNNEAYIVMDYIEGQSLEDYIHATSRAGQFPSPGDIVGILASISSAIDYAHLQGIIHGAIRPSNIVFDKHSSSRNPLGEPKLMGFGTNSIQAPLTLPLDTVNYISPEKAQGYNENARSDIYSLGVILYELSTGTQPFQGDTPTEVMMQHIHATPTSPALINPHILPGLTSTIMRSMSKDPIARFPTASAMVVSAAKALNIPTQEVLSQSGTWMGSTVNMSMLGGQTTPNTMNSPTYLTPLQQSQKAQGALPAPAVPGGPISQAPVVPHAYTPTGPAQAPVSWSGTGGMQSIPAETPAQSSQQWPQSYSGPTHGAVSGANYPAQSSPVAPVSQGPSVLPQAKPPPPARRGPQRWLVALISVLILAIVGSGLGFLILNNQQQATQEVVAAPVVGQALFVSSGQYLSERSTSGIADRLQINLQDLPDPQTGKNYYVWLLGDKEDGRTDVSPILLGMSSRGGPINIFHPGDKLGTNLLANYSRLLITEEDATTPPTNPSLDNNDRKYYAAFSQVKVGDYSLLDHLRHLLAQDPKLQEVGLIGGLDIWLFRNTLKILEQAGSIRDARNGNGSEFMRRQLVRMLNYLDGDQYVRTEKLPPDLPAIMIDPVKARVALLEFDPQQQPPPYLKHIGNHLRESIQMPGVTVRQKELAIQINKALNNVQAWLQEVRKIAAELVQMPPAKLLAPETIPLLDELFVQANKAFVGETDPNTNTVREGVVQIHYNTLGLATFEIKPYEAQ